MGRRSFPVTQINLEIVVTLYLLYQMHKNPDISELRMFTTTKRESIYGPQMYSKIWYFVNKKVPILLIYKIYLSLLLVVETNNDVIFILFLLFQG